MLGRAFYVESSIFVSNQVLSAEPGIALSNWAFLCQTSVIKYCLQHWSDLDTYKKRLIPRPRGQFVWGVFCEYWRQIDRLRHCGTAL